MIVNGDSVYAIGLQKIEVEALRAAIDGVAGSTTSYTAIADNLNQKYLDSTNRVNESTEAIKSLVNLGLMPAETLADALGIS
jgi:hypothetical protein